MCSPATRAVGVEVGISGVQGQPRVHSMFEISLNNVRLPQKMRVPGWQRVILGPFTSHPCVMHIIPIVGLSANTWHPQPWWPAISSASVSPHFLSLSVTL